MVQKLFFNSKFTFSAYLTAMLFFFISIKSNAQCAGIDNSITICDITNNSNKNVDLNLLLGIHTAGGTWTDDDNSGGLDTATGILNAQQVFRSGIYHYTYKIDGITGCTDNESVIEVTIGGYAGVPGPNNSICSSDKSYSLFQVFQGIPVLAPQSGGTWSDLDNSGGLNTVTGVLNASVPIPYNTYSYKYTINAIGTCAETSAQVSVSIYRSPEPGIASGLQLCSNQVGAYTNLDLFTRLSGADADGIWSESGTSELSSPTDSTIDIQNIYNTKGPGVYRFTYTVSPPKDDRVCSDQSSTVIISIGEQLDFTGATLSVNPDGVCENEMSTTTYTGILRQGIKAIANGNYRVSYTIAGVGSFTTFQNFNNGVLLFPIDSSNFTLVKDYTIRVNNVTLVSSPVFCSSIVGTIQDILHISPSPKIDNATLTIDPVCQGSDAIVQFSGTSNLSDGNYDIIYNLSGSNTLNGIPATMNVIGGLSSFTIPSFYISRTGTSSVSITKITNLTTTCSNISTLKSDFIVNPALDINNLAIAVNNICLNQPANVNLTGLGLLTSIDVTYNLSGSNNVGSKIVSLTAVSGQGTFSVPASDIPNTGLTTLAITNITNTITGCTFAINNKSANFTVISPPAIPVAADQPFCTSENATVANLVPNGNQYQWFDTAASTVPLTNTTPLLTGDYFVKQINPVTGCESGLKMVNITINTTPQIDTARLSVATTCQSYNVTVLLGGSSNLTNGNYTILYDLTGDNTGADIYAVLTVVSGIGVFSIPAALVPNAGSTTVSITKITNPTTNCSNTVNLNKSFTTNPLPDISNMSVNINNVCQNQPAFVEITGLGTLSTININFSLSGANTLNIKTMSLNVVSGQTNFEIPNTDIPNAGVTTFNMTNITNTQNGCPIFIDHKTDFKVNGPPDISSIAIVINDGCPNQPLNVAISGLGSLTDVILSYAVSGTNVISTQTVQLEVTGGNANFSIPGSSLLLAGTNTLSLSNLVDFSTSCYTIINSISQNFDILPLPSNPAANSQGFCKENASTVADLFPNGAQYKWYDSAGSTTPLLPTTLLVAGIYYLTEVNPTTGCESHPTEVSVQINSMPTPTLETDGGNFCGADKPTIQNLSSKTNYTGDLTWYNAPVNGTALANSDFLTEGTTYYGIDYNSITKCTSEPVEATVTLFSCNVNPDGLKIPDGFSPNGDGVNDTFKILDIEYLFPNFTIEIFNRYGNIMFKGNVNKPDWDGKNSNSSFISGDAGTGVYFYIINYNKDNFSPRQGQLYLNR
ncbi:gliding motility-associated C-terminal domain-containing protein [Flavobacterium aquicola]|uniref:Gliding motility-associated-like protein n=1 Tax=Flavobacterium aquicola TaxID=1682742 RepID=A0A3E0EJH9_9FLAO|nr:gliding motility-associated C-terminal domain-containing protein [Flavobacterium aquicola]REG97880.1 gliding motility-associated-like protein [Flavobacterium aquicola]